MANTNQVKEKIKRIYDVLPKLDDRRCGYESCGQFARAVAEGRAPCYGCVTGSWGVAAKVCEIMGTRVPAEAVPQAGAGPELYGPGPGVGVGMGRGMSRGVGGGVGRRWAMFPGQRMGPGYGMGRGFGRGFGRGRRGR
jgi:hypothetical protein